MPSACSLTHAEHSYVKIGIAVAFRHGAITRVRSTSSSITSWFTRAVSRRTYRQWLWLDVKHEAPSLARAATTELHCTQVIHTAIRSHYALAHVQVLQIETRSRCGAHVAAPHGCGRTRYCSALPESCMHAGPDNPTVPALRTGRTESHGGVARGLDSRSSSGQPLRDTDGWNAADEIQVRGTGSCSGTYRYTRLPFNV